jgi:hypothetical protein
MAGPTIALTEEEAIIRKRFLTQTVATSVTAAPPFKKLVKKYVYYSMHVFLGSRLLYIC